MHPPTRRKLRWLLLLPVLSQCGAPCFSQSLPSVPSFKISPSSVIKVLLLTDFAAHLHPLSTSAVDDSDQMSPFMRSPASVCHRCLHCLKWPSCLCDLVPVRVLVGLATIKCDVLHNWWISHVWFASFVLWYSTFSLWFKSRTCSLSHTVANFTYGKDPLALKWAANVGF